VSCITVAVELHNTAASSLPTDAFRPIIPRQRKRPVPSSTGVPNDATRAVEDFAMPKIAGASHIALTVRDMEASAAWYQRVFGWQLLRRFSSTEAGTPRILLLDTDSFFALGLCQPDDASDDRFDHRRTGLDHFAFRVADQAELDAWATHLDNEGVDHSPIRGVEGLGRFISFEDPDGIQFEFWL
jgi:glyoxylase I family protein